MFNGHCPFSEFIIGISSQWILANKNSWALQIPNRMMRNCFVGLNVSGLVCAGEWFWLFGSSVNWNRELLERAIWNPEFNPEFNQCKCWKVATGRRPVIRRSQFRKNTPSHLRLLNVTNRSEFRFGHFNFVPDGRTFLHSSGSSSLLFIVWIYRLTQMSYGLMNGLIADRSWQSGGNGLVDEAPLQELQSIERLIEGESICMRFVCDLYAPISGLLDYC